MYDITRVFASPRLDITNNSSDEARKEESVGEVNKEGEGRAWKEAYSENFRMVTLIGN